jgi:hypothetical protein
MGYMKIYLWPYVNKALLLMNMDTNQNFSTTSDVILPCRILKVIVERFICDLM